VAAWLWLVGSFGISWSLQGGTPAVVFSPPVRCWPLPCGWRPGPAWAGRTSSLWVSPPRRAHLAAAWYPSVSGAHGGVLPGGTGAGAAGFPAQVPGTRDLPHGYVRTLAMPGVDVIFCGLWGTYVWGVGATCPGVASSGAHARRGGAGLRSDWRGGGTTTLTGTASAACLRPGGMRGACSESTARQPACKYFRLRCPHVPVQAGGGRSPRAVGPRSRGLR